ncbi:MAG TPA: GDSL-type esterase/lipase family protein [Actinophytocola sp.]|uniref:GDSL-type esterase/lipase family protein n=1 Tax=Actinophytocola sp. TaxID=1872138 RepID=UPI002DB91540|nr:GDSL-type esterase/lipase family protein [Actinophytocola sp.]HEU5469545.1 GDSL-type esterase/lipase family protein [Actinophytocola sp.]
MSTSRVLVRTAAVLVTMLGLGVAAGPVTQAQPEPQTHQPRPAVVSLGDSYISGEAGRWRGNSADPAGDRRGTDRAFVAAPEGPRYDPAIVYGPTAANGCHRSDVAEITHVRRLIRPATVNLACSGATTANVLRAGAGGVPFKGEAPQNDQLALVARQHRVTAIVLSIGGNDVGFSDIVTACVLAFLTNGAPCRVTQQPVVDQRLPVMREAVGRTIDDLRATMADAGYRDGSFRLVLQSYPTPLATAAQMRYPQGPQRQTVGGCPVLDTDADWDLAAQISAALRTVAADKGVQFLDLTGAFAGHELCSARAQQSDGTPADATDEWLRWIDLAGQGDLNESLHPNAFGQRALGRCLSLTLLVRRDVSCHPVPNRPASWMYLRTLR